MKVLVAEDDSSLNELMVEVFSMAGHAVTSAKSARAARKELMLQSFDVVVVDLYLGDDSGLNIATLATYASPDCKVVMVTGSSLFANGELFDIAPSITTVLRKPVAVDELLAISEHGVVSEQRDVPPKQHAV